MPIDFVYFDLGNILLSFDPLLACRGLARVMQVTTDQAREALYDSGLEEEYEHGRIDSASFAQQLRSRLGRSAANESDDAVSDAVILESISDMFQPVDGMEGILQAVRNTGRRVGLLSNTCEAHWNWIQAADFAVMDFQFDTTILSYEIGSMKPDRRIYQAAEAAAKVATEQILFIDDRLENVTAATSFGWQAQQCLGGEPAIDVLRQFRVLESVN